MDNKQTIDTKNIFNGATITAGTTVNGQVFSSDSKKMNGNASLQIEVTGDGTAKFMIEQSNNHVKGQTVPYFVRASSGYIIVEGFTKTGGIGTDGKDIIDVPMILSGEFRIVCEETGGANDIVVKSWLTMQ